MAALAFVFVLLCLVWIRVHAECQHEMALILGGSCGNSISFHVTATDTNTTYSNSTVLADLRTPSRSKSVVVGDQVYVISGLDGDKVLDTIQLYNITTGSVRLGSHLFLGRQRHTAVTWRTKIVVCGGYDGISYDEPIIRNSCEIYVTPQADGHGDYWHLDSRFDMPVAVYGHGSEILDGEMYIFGGSTWRDVLTNTYRWDNRLRRWMKRSPMLTQRYPISSVVVPTSKGSMILVCGSEYRMGLKPTCEKFNGATWTTAGEMHDAKQYHSMVFMNNMVFIFGGLASGRGVIDDVDRYDPESEVYEPTDMKMAQVCHETSAVVVCTTGTRLKSIHNEVTTTTTLSPKSDANADDTEWRDFHGDWELERFRLKD